MKIGIIGAGFIGRTLARLAVQHGCEAMVSNSRGPASLTSTARATHALIGTVEEAAAFGDIVVLAIPFHARASLPVAALAGKVVVDAMNYYPDRDGAIAELDRRETTTSGMVSALLPGARVVKAFNAILANDLESGGRLAGVGGCRAIPVASDDSAAKALVMQFQERIGFDAFDAGDLAGSWRFERGKPAYCVSLDREGVVRALAAAARDDELPVPRAEAPNVAKRMPSTPPDWVLGFFRDIDAKRFDPPFAAFLTDDAHMLFGVHDIRGRNDIIATLKMFDSDMETAHRVLDYWDGGQVKFLRGEVTMTKRDGSPPQTPVFVHVWTLADGPQDRVTRICGAVGPMAE